MRIKNLRCPKRMLTVLAVAGALFLATGSRTTFTQSGPQPQVTLNVPSEVLIGEDFTFTVKFKNAGNQIGYGPFIDLVLDAGGANITKPPQTPPCACDGITFVKAEMVGVVGGPVSLNSFPVLAPCNPTPPSVPLSHPFASSSILPVTVPAGAQLITLELPFGSFDPTQPEIVVEVTAHVSNFADAGAPLKISARGGFRYGTNPLDDPSTDPPILSDTATNSALWAAQAQTKPTVITISKKYLGPEDETATGPNFTSFYPLQYQITVDIANGQTVSKVTVTDCFPNNLAFQSVVSVSPTGATVTPPPSGVPNNPPNNCVTVTWPSLTGASGPDATVVVDFFIPEKDANGNPVLPPNCQPVQSVNDVKAEGDWTPIDPCDTSPAHVVSDVTTSDHILADKCLAIQKKVAVFQDTGAPGPTPGDVLQYTLTFQISDFKTFGKLEIRDQLSDGQQFLAAPAPTLTVKDQFGTVSGSFIPFLDLFVTGDPNSTCQGIKGTTNLVFMVSQKMTSLFPSNPRLLAGILTGGWATTPTSSVPATGQIVFYARIQDQFSFPQNHPGDPFVDKDDPLANCVTIRGEVLTNVNPPMIPSPTGVTATDNSKTLTSIVTDVIKKTVYAVKRGSNFICGPSSLPGNPPPCPAKPQVTPGDEVTFRIEKVIPSSDAENLTIQDWLPLPIFDVADPDANGASGPPMSFSATACGIPVPGQACLGPTNTLTVVPTFTSNVPTNSVTFNYGTFNDPTNTPRKIDLLFTLTATNDPFADGLFLTNEAQECEKNTFNMTFCQVAIAQVQMAEPKVRIMKGVVASDNPNAIFSPAAPPSGTFTPPGGSCPRFTGTINSSNIGSLNLNSNVSGVDANDTVTFAIVVENLGSGPNGVFDVKVRDIFPFVSPLGPATCFVPVASLCVTDGTGAGIPFTTILGPLGSFGIELTDSLTQGALGPSHPTNGKNIAVIIFDAKIIPNIKPGCCDNRARLENYSNTENGPNFVAAGFGGPFEDTAEVCVKPKATKSIKTTSEAHTPGTPSGPPLNPEQVAIGEIVRYRLEVVVPETTSPSNYKLQDFLPAGLSYLPGTTTSTLVSNGGLSASNFPPVVTGGPFTCANSGADPIFDFGTVTNTDNDSNQEFIVLEFNALVCNIASNINGTVLPNQFGVFVDGSQVATANVVNAVVVEPNLTITKTVPPSPVVQGGTVTYTVTVTNAGTADAFDVQFIDTLPPELTFVANSVGVTGACLPVPGISLGAPSVTCARVPVNGVVTITYKAVANPATCPVTLTNTAKVTWTSLPGPNGTTTNPTGSSTPGSSGAINGERDGSTAPALPNKYAAIASAPLTVNCPPCVDPSQLPGMVLWLTGDNNTLDISGLNNHGAWQPNASAAAYTAGEVGPAFDFTGPNSVKVNDHTSLDFGTSNMSIDAWVKLKTNLNQGGFIVNKIEPLPGNTGYGFFIKNQRLQFQFGNAITYSSSPLSFVVGQWHHVAVTLDRTSTNPALKFYLDGTQVANFTSPSAISLTNAVDLFVGQPFASSVADLAIDELEIFNRPLSPQEIQLIVNAGPAGKCKCVPPPSGMVAWYPLDEQNGATTVSDIAPPPSSTVNDVGTPKPAPVGPIGTGPTPVAGKVGAGALYFYGPFVEVPPSADLNFTGDFSIDAWIGVVECGGGGGELAPIVDKWDPSTQTGFSLFVDQPSPSTGFLKLQFNSTLFTSTALPTGADPLANTGPWVHVAVTVNRTTGVGTFYINGAPAGTFTVPAGSITNALPMLIGEIRVPGPRCELAIDELELFKRVLMPKEIQDIFTSDSAGKCKPQQGQICVVKFEDLDGDGVQDPGEPLLPNWMFNVTDQNNNPVGTITTSPPGTPPACLTVAAPGTYTVTETVQSGWMPTTPNPQTVAVQPGQTVNVAFGNKRPCDLQIRKSINPNPAQSGQPVTITLTVMNVGTGACPPGPLPGTVVSDPRPPGLTFNLPVTINQSGGSANWQCSLGVPTGDLSCTTPNPLPPGYSATFTFMATVTGTAGSNIQNCATVTNQNDINTQNNQSCVTLQVTGCVTPPANMTAWWPLDETSGTTANDLAGFPNNGTHVNGPTPTPGVVAGALRFDGVNDHVRVSDHPELDVGTGNFTLDAWVRTTASSGVIVLVDKRSGPTPLGYSLFLANGRLGFQMANGVGSSTCASSPTPGVACVNYVAPTTSPNVADGQWRHVAAVVDRANATTGVRLYVDGVQVFAGAPLTGNLDNASDLYLGVRTPAQQGGAFFRGDLDEVELIKRVLMPKEIQDIFTADSAGKCKPQQGQICVVKFEDLDGDGVQDPGEPLLPNWMLNVTDPSNNPVGTITTSPPGTPPACLTVPAPGTYTVTEQVQSGWMPTTPNPQTVTVQPGQTVNVTFGNKKTGMAEVCVFKFEDKNGNGIHEPNPPNNEPLLAGWTFNVSPGPPNQVTTTPQGGICFGVPAPGTYTISEMIPPPPPTWTPTTPTSQTVTVQPSQLVNLFFGNKKEECDLMIRKSVSPNPAQSGQPVTITLTVMNVGTGACPPGPLPGTVVSDPRPPGLTFNLPVTINQSGGSANWQCSLGVPTGDLSCTTPNPLPPGYSATFTFMATVTGTAGSNIQNCATVTNQNDINTQNNQSCVTLQVTGCVTPPPNMVAWWPLDETSGTTANDLAGVPNNGTHVNGPIPTPGMVGGALRFDGVNDHVTVADHAELNFGTGDLSIDAWIRTTGTTDILPIVDKRATVGNLPRGYTFFLFNGRLAFQLADAVGTGFTNYISNASVNDGKWHHVAATIQRTGGSPALILYVDGVPAPSGTFANPRTGTLTNTNPLWIGQRHPVPGAQSARYFIGDIDEVEMFNRALTQPEIQAIFQAGSAGKCKGRIEGMKWNDANGNGVINTGEAGLSGWTIQLTGPVNQTTTTGSGGTYAFTGLPPGTYTVSEVLQSGWTRTFPPGPGTHTVTLAANQVVTGRNFGNRRVIVFPDFIVRNLTAIPPGIPGGNVALGSQVLVRFDIVNQGTGEAGPASHEIRLFIPAVPGAADVNVLLATVMTGPLAAGASQSFNQLVTIPREARTGSARIRVLADAPNGVSESDEGNNMAEFLITLTRPGP